MIDPDKILNDLIKTGSEWADKEHAANLLEQTRRSVRSAVMTERFLQGDNGAKAEAYAEASEKYQEHINKMCEARKQADLAHVNYHATKVWAEAIRTEESSRRAEMNNLR